MFTNHELRQQAGALLEGRAGPLSGPEFTHPVVYLLRTKNLCACVGCGCVGKLSSNLPKKRDMNGLLPYKFVWEEAEVSPIFLFCMGPIHCV